MAAQIVEPAPRTTPSTQWLPPRWFIRTAWVMHRAIYSVTSGRRGLALPKPGQAGLLRLNTVGRHSGQPRSVIVAYFEDGSNLVTLAMNGWSEGDPAWWLNLQARPETAIDLKSGSRRVRARAADGDERARLWARFSDTTGWGDIDAFSKRRSSTAVVVLEPAA